MIELDTIGPLVYLAVVVVGLCALFATAATAVTLLARLPGWAWRHWRGTPSR